MFIEALPLADVDWPRVLGLVDVTHQVPLTTMEELERLRFAQDSRRKRDRAAAAVQFLAENADALWSEQGLLLRNHVHLRLLPIEGASAAKEANLDADVYDNRLIGTALAFGREVTVLTTDLPMHVRCKARGVSSVHVRGELLRSNEPDPLEKKARDLAQELAHYKNRLPQLKLEVEPVHVQLARVLRPSPQERDNINFRIEMRFHEEERQRVRMRDEESDFIWEEENGFAARIQDRLQGVADFHNERLAWEQEHGRSLLLHLGLRNLGTATAHGVAIKLNLPQQIRALTRADFPREPTDFVDSPTLRDEPSALEAGDLMINGSVVRLGLDRVGNSDRAVLRSFWATLAPGYEPDHLVIPYTLGADELPDPIDGALKMGVSWADAPAFRDVHW